MKYSPTSPTSPPLYACAITSQSFKDSDQSSCPFTIAYARTLQVLERSKKKTAVWATDEELADNHSFLCSKQGIIIGTWRKEEAPETSNISSTSIP